MTSQSLVGQKFGRLTVVGEAPARNYKKYWYCECDCGEAPTIKVQQSSLTAGNTTSCGCAKKGVNINLDLIGKKFGSLTIQSLTDKRGLKGEAVWSCLCDCGNICEANTNQLRNGKKKSCGCLKGELMRKEYEKSRVDGVVVHNIKRKKRVDNTSGVKGVYYDKRNGKWDVELKVKGQRYRKSGFKTIEEASAYRKELEEQHHQPYIEKYEKEKNKHDN